RFPALHRMRDALRSLGSLFRLFGGADPGDDHGIARAEPHDGVIVKAVPFHDRVHGHFVQARQVPNGLAVGEEVVRAIVELWWVLWVDAIAFLRLAERGDVDDLGGVRDAELLALRD